MKKSRFTDSQRKLPRQASPSEISGSSLRSTAVMAD